MKKPSIPNTPIPAPSTGPEIITKMAEAPSLDRFFTSKPPFTELELRDFIAKSRAERALWELKQK